MRDENGVRADDTPGARALGGAAVGAGFGGLFGAVIGWLLGAQVTTGQFPVPTIGPVVGQWVLPSTIVGLLAGAAIGALVGALAAITTVGRPPVTSEVVTPASTDDDSVVEADGHEAEPVAAVPLSSDARENRTLLGDQEPFLSATAPTLDQESQGEAHERSELPVKGKRRKRSAEVEATALVVDTPAEESAPEMTASRRRAPRSRRSAAEAESRGPEGPEPALIRDSRSPEPAKGRGRRSNTEVIDVSDEQKGRDPNTFTGTKDAIDPETGAIGTAGTPVTTGYGVSGSTVGTGSRRRQKKQEKDDFRGATPDSASYDIGGRGTGDAGVLHGTEREASVVERNTDAGRVEASIPRDTEGRDVYEQSEGYVENLERDAIPPSVTERTRGTQESAGTDIPGTGDPRGLGDNTDK